MHFLPHQMCSSFMEAQSFTQSYCHKYPHVHQKQDHRLDCETQLWLLWDNTTTWTWNRPSYQALSQELTEWVLGPCPGGFSKKFAIKHPSQIEVHWFSEYSNVVFPGKNPLHWKAAPINYIWGKHESSLVSPLPIPTHCGIYSQDPKKDLFTNHIPVFRKRTSLRKQNQAIHLSGVV